MSDSTTFGYMKRRITALEKEQSLLGQRVDELERRLREENRGPIPGDIGLVVDDFVLQYGGPRACQCEPMNLTSGHRCPPTSDATPGSETEQIELEQRALRMLPPEQGDEHR